MLSTISEDKRSEFANLFNYTYNTNNQTNSIKNTISKYAGKVKNVCNEDAQIYINDLRKDDREF